jgi:cytochrome oxidase Cu insertion factor (SCO1/SenC/PrrC family)
MNHSLVGADRNTHCKIIAVALVSAIVLVVVGLIARIDNSATATAQLHANGPVLKVGKSMTVTNRDGSTVR